MQLTERATVEGRFCGRSPRPALFAAPHQALPVVLVRARAFDHVAVAEPVGKTGGLKENLSSVSWAEQVMPTPPDSPPPSVAVSHKGLVTPATTSNGLRNLLKVPTSNADRYFFMRQCCYIFYCARIKVHCNYPKITSKSVIEDERVQDAFKSAISEEIEKEEIDANSYNKVYKSLLLHYKKQALNTIQKMRSALSSSLIRITGYVLFKVFSFLFMSVTVTEGQLQMIESASKRNLPLIFVPLHRSHVDYLFVTWILFNREIPAPIVAAGDNLRMPIFGWLLRGLGGFFIRRKLESRKSRRDCIYRAILQTYMTQALHAGYNLEFFIEGGRTRTGKPCQPKGGLLSVIVDAYVNGSLHDALIVPIAINYDKLLDGNFVHEQLGQKKVPETFWRAVRAIAKVLSTSFGHSRIDFSQPFSLREFFQSQRKHLSNGFVPRGLDGPPQDPQSFEGPQQGHQKSFSTGSSGLSSISEGRGGGEGGLHATRSNSSLFGNEVTDEYRHFIKALAAHIVYDAEKCQAIMSTNAVAWLLSYLYREGTSLDKLSASLALLHEDLRDRGRDTGFSGQPLHVTIHAVTMLGASLVQVTGDLLGGDPAGVFVRPVTSLPNVIELNYYANSMSPIYAVDAIVATSLITISDCDLWSYKDVTTDCIVSQAKLLDRSTRLSRILSHEFVLVPPCGSLADAIQDAIHNLVVSGLLVNQTSHVRKSYSDSLSEDDDSCNFANDTFFLLSPTASNLERLSTPIRGLSPLIESYYATTLHLNSLVDKSCVDHDFVKGVQTRIASLLKRRVLLYGESIAADPIRNAVKLFESLGVLESYARDSLRLLSLSSEYESDQQLWHLQEEIRSFRV